MTGTESRLVELMDEHLDLGREPDLNRGFADSGISSLNAVAFIKVVEREFGVAVAPEDCDKITTLGNLIAYLESKLG
ncbi:MAG: phosphopantetheine-binding protein [Gemmatimonadota bacterium]|nr:phosphopantetheine-binding protein [Gemmatimonadota bacterium]MDE2983561.1 phosphopantetheine-binding protein [Gemmatimonadota bacterium]